MIGVEEGIVLKPAKRLPNTPGSLELIRASASQYALQDRTIPSRGFGTVQHWQHLDLNP